MTWLSVLLFFALISVSWSCPSLSFKVAKNETCHGHAILLNPSYFVQFPNGSCVLHNVCSRIELKNPRRSISYEQSKETFVQFDKKQRSFSVIKKTVIKFVRARNLTWQCPTFEKVPIRQKVLLMRTHASTKVSPYLYFFKSTANPVQLTYEEANAKRLVNFKSPLLATDSHPSLRQIFVDMYDSRGRLLTSVSFRIKPNENIKKGRWFSKERLLSARPWSASRMKSAKRVKFFLFGVETGQVKRRFLIVDSSSLKCNEFSGYMAIVERGKCRWEQKKKYSPSYLWAMSDFAHGRFASNTKEAAEFRIYGEFESSPQLFVRRSYEC